MDKYEFNIKLEQIKKLSGKKDFKTAAKIAKAMDLRKVKDWATLSLIINAQELAGDLEEARDVAILAYNRNLGGRRLVYKLTELFIDLGEFEDAESLYKEYVRMSQLDVNKYILLYKLRKAQNVPDARLIEILEEYKDHEIDEKYLCELAELYSKTGRVDDCLRECEEISLWFQEGIYVERALRIKQQYEHLTTAQQKILDMAEKQEEVDIEKIKQLKFAEAKEKARLLEDEIEDVFREDDKKNNSIDYILDDNKGSIDNILDYNKGSIDSILDDNKGSINNILDDNTDTNTEVDHDSEFEESETNFIEKEENEQSDSTVAQDFNINSPLAGAVVPDISLNGTAECAEGIAKAGQSLRELIEKAKRKIESNYEQVKREDEEERVQEQVDKMEVPVTNFNLYDTQNVQKELAKNLDELMKEHPEEDVFKAISAMNEQPQKSDHLVKEVKEVEVEEVEVEEDEQIEGQLSLTDWIEAIQEEKYGKQNTKEFSKAELEDMLEQRENQKEEYERLLEKQKQQAEANGEFFNEEEARRHAEEQVNLQSAKNDLAIRTGKATVKIEAEVEKIREAATFTTQIQEMAEKEAERIVEEAKIEAELEAKKQVVHEDVFQDIFEDTDAEDDDEDDDEDETNLQLELTAKTEVKLDETAATDSEYIDADGQEAQEAYDDMIDDYEPENDKRVEIPKSVKKYFKKYSDMSGLEDQLAHYFEDSKEENIMNTSEIGNIIISGNRSSDKTNLAVSIIKALNTLYPENPRKIAKTTGESINHKGIAKAMTKLKGTALIVEDAGVIEPKRISEMLQVMDHDTEGMIVIFEDADTEINVLLSVNPDISKKFNYRIVLKQYTVNELVEMAKKYAGKRQHAIDDSALLQLYLKIDRLHAQVDCVRLDQIKEIIDRAIVKAEKRASRKFFGAIKKKRGDNGDIFFLTEVDFKD